METLIEKNTNNLLKQLYATDKGAARMLDLMAKAVNRRKDTTVDDVSQQLDISRPKAMKILQLLGKTGCGTFRKGRETQNVQNPTRIEWINHYAQIGKVARGELSEFSAISTVVHEDTTINTALSSPPSQFHWSAPLTIKDAKRLLAEALGVDEASVEITIKG